MTGKLKRRFALCVDDADCEDLELRKVYAVLPDDRAAAEGFVRVVDESGEDYLYDATQFVFVEVPLAAERAFAGRAAARALAAPNDRRALTRVRRSAPAPARR